jgi:hypothetical protein
MTEILISSLIDGIKKNNLPWGKYAFEQYDENDKPMFCVLGIGLKNCGITGVTAITSLDVNIKRVLSGVMQFNDNYATSFEEAMNYAIEALEPYASHSVGIEYEMDF